MYARRLGTQSASTSIGVSSDACRAKSRILRRVDDLSSIVEAGDMEIDVLYIPLRAEQIEGFIFEAIDYATSQGVLCFDAEGYPI